MSKITNALHRAELDRSTAYPVFSARPQTIFVKNGRVASGPAAVSFPPAPAEIVPVENISKTLESWEQAIALVAKQLESCEEQMAAQASEQSHLQERLQAAEALTAKIERERIEIRQAQEQATQKAASLEKTRTLWVRQLEALRECAVLSQACRAAEQELKANAECVNQSIASQKRLAEELAQYQQKDQVLRGQVEALRFKLASALASTGTTDVHKGAV